MTNKNPSPHLDERDLGATFNKIATCMAGIEANWQALITACRTAAEILEEQRLK